MKVLVTEHVALEYLSEVTVSGMTNGTVLLTFDSLLSSYIHHLTAMEAEAIGTALTLVGEVVTQSRGLRSRIKPLAEGG